MNKTTQQAVNAFMQGVNFKSSNTKVIIRDSGTFMYLFDNMIAHKQGNEIFLTTAGWETTTTKERLNGILKAYNLGTITQKKFVWYIGSEEFNGCRTFKVN